MLDVEWWWKRQLQHSIMWSVYFAAVPLAFAFDEFVFRSLHPRDPGVSKLCLRYNLVTSSWALMACRWRRSQLPNTLKLPIWKVWPWKKATKKPAQGNIAAMSNLLRRHVEGERCFQNFGWTMPVTFPSCWPKESENQKKENNQN